MQKDEKINSRSAPAMQSDLNEIKLIIEGTKGSAQLHTLTLSSEGEEAAHAARSPTFQGYMQAIEQDVQERGKSYNGMVLDYGVKI